MTRVGPAALAAGLLLLVAAPAAAASGITSPGAGEVVAADAVVPLRALVEGPAAGPSELSLQAPGAPAAEVVAVSTDPEGGELAYDLDTSCAAAVCTGRQPAANGTWTLRLSGAAEDERSFVLRIPPAAPEEVAAERSEAGVTVRWRQGDEPDLRAYRVEDAAGKVVRDRIGLDACDAERRCSAEVPEAAGAWTVRAYRATCPDCTDLLASPTSSAVRAEGVEGAPLQAVGAEPSAQPKKPGRRGPDQAQAFRGAFGAGRPVVQQAAPPTSRPARSALPVAPGPVDRELGYGEREVVVTEARPPLSRAQEAVTGFEWTAARVRLLVLSGLMVAGALWLRRWARRAIEE